MRFCMGAENTKMKSAEKSAETGGHQVKHWLKTCQPPFCFFDSPFAVVAASEKTCEI